MASLFISYSRKNTEAARKLTEAFKGQGLEFWIDWEGIPPTVDWWKEVENGIEEADIFLFLLSPDSCKSKICKQEIEHAIKKGKRLIPLVVCDVKGEEVPAELSHLNWIFIRETDNFDLAFARLITAIKTDYAWAQAHRDLQVKALGWEKSGHDNSFLLFGKELQDAEFQLATNTSKEPHPTDLQREYVHASRKAVDRRRARNAGITVVAAIALAALAIFGFVQAGLADERARVSRAGELAAQSDLMRSTDLALSSLLSIEAYNTADIPETRVALLENIQSQSQLIQHLYGQTSSVSSVAFNREGTMIASGGCHSFDEVTADCLMGEIILWEAKSGDHIRTTLIGHPSRVVSLSFSPDGRTLASGSRDGSILLWDINTFQPIETPLSGHTDEVSSLVFSADGKTLASTSYYETIVWDLTTYQFDMLPVGVISPDSKILATASCSYDENLNCRGSKITLFDRNTGKSSDYPLSIAIGEPGILAFSPDGQKLALTICMRDENDYCIDEIVLWDTKTFQLIDPPLMGHAGQVENLVFSQDGKKLASGSCQEYDAAPLCRTGEIIVWDISTHSSVSLLSEGYPAWPLGFTISPDGKTLASGNYDNKLTLWSVDTQEPTSRRLWESEGGAGTLTILRPDGQIFADASCQAFVENSGHCIQTQIRLWDVASGKRLETPAIEFTGEIAGLAFSPDGNLLAYTSCQSWNESDGSCTNSELMLRDSISGARVDLQFTEFSGSLGSLAFSVDGKSLASGNCQSFSEFTGYCAKSEIMLWNVNSGEYVGTPFSGFTGEIRSLAFSQAILAVGICQKVDDLGTCLKGEIMLWDLVTHQRISPTLTGVPGGPESLAFSPDGKVLAFVNCRQFDSNGNSLCLEGEIILWDIAAGKPINPSLSGFTGELMSLTFSRDGKVLASSGCYAADLDHYCIDGQIVLWDTVTHKLSGRLVDGYDGSEGYNLINSVRFSPDGDRLVSKNELGSVIVWDINLQSWIETICKRVGRNLTESEWEKYSENENYGKTCEQWPNHPSYYQSIAEAILSNSQDPSRVQAALDKVKAEMERDLSIEDPNLESSRIVEREIKAQITDSLLNLDLLTQAKKLKLDLANLDNLHFLNYLCWEGSLAGYAAEVLEYCEWAVALRPDDADIRNHRGLARALSGDFTGAINDFQFYVDAGYDWAGKHQAWINDLKAERNPFTDEVLEQLRIESESISDFG